MYKNDLFVSSIVVICDMIAGRSVLLFIYFGVKSFVSNVVSALMLYALVCV